MDPQTLAQTIETGIGASTASSTSCIVECALEAAENARQILQGVIANVCPSTASTSANASDPAVCGVDTQEMIEQAVSALCSESCVPDTEQLIAGLQQWVRELCPAECGEDPGEVVAEVQRQIYEALPSQTIVAFLLAAIDEASRREVEYSESHPPDVEVLPDFTISGVQTDGALVSSPVAGERVAIGLATGKVLSTTTLDLATAWKLEPGGQDDPEASAASAQGGCASYGDRNDMTDFEPNHGDVPKNNKSVAGGHDAFLFRVKNAGTQTSSSGKVYKVKKYIQCTSNGYKRKNNYVVTKVRNYLGPYVKSNHVREDGQWDGYDDDGKANATVGFQVGTPVAGVNASIPISNNGRLDGSRWLAEDWAEPRHRPYSSNIVNAFWDGKSDRFQGTVTIGRYVFRHKGDFPHTPDAEEDDPDEAHEGFFFHPEVWFSCGNVFGIGC